MKQVFTLSEDEALELMAREFLRQHPELDFAHIEIQGEHSIFSGIKYKVKIDATKRQTPRTLEMTERILQGYNTKYSS